MHTFASMVSTRYAPDGLGLPSHEQAIAEFRQALSDIRTDAPYFYEYLINIKGENPEEYREIVTDHARRLRHLEQMKKHEPQEYEKEKKLYGMEKKERNVA